MVVLGVSAFSYGRGFPVSTRQNAVGDGLGNKVCTHPGVPRIQGDLALENMFPPP